MSFLLKNKKIFCFFLMIFVLFTPVIGYAGNCGDETKARETFFNSPNGDGVNVDGVKLPAYYLLSANKFEGVTDDFYNDAKDHLAHAETCFYYLMTQSEENLDKKTNVIPIYADAGKISLSSYKNECDPLAFVAYFNAKILTNKNLTKKEKQAYITEYASSAALSQSGNSVAFLNCLLKSIDTNTDLSTEEKEEGKEIIENSANEAQEKTDEINLTSAKAVKKKLNEYLNSNNWAQRKAAKTLISQFESKAANTVGTVLINAKKIDMLSDNGFAKQIYDLISLVGFALISFYFILGLVDKASSSQFSIEQLFRLLITAVAAKMLISSGWDIMSSFFDVGMNITEGLLEANKGLSNNIPDSVYLSMADDVKSIGNGMWACLGVIITAWPGSVLAKICSIVAQLVVWSVLIEIVVKTVLAPIAFAEVAMSGIHGSGANYLKKILVADLQFAAIVLALIISNLVATGISNADIAGDGTQVFIVNILTIFMVVKASGYVNDLVR